MNTDFNTYNNTSGYVTQPASMDRAHREAATGISSERARNILNLMIKDPRNPEGWTWKELGDHFGLHHGQISGALSNLHRAGEIFMLRTQRNKCHPYVHAMYRHQFTDDQRIDAPVKTKSNQRLSDLEELLDDLMLAIGLGRITDPDVIAQVNALHNNT